MEQRTHRSLPLANEWLRKKIHFFIFFCLSPLEFLLSLPRRNLHNDPFVYRLGLQIFILARWVRLPYGSPFLW
jgi:hypothetical protein